MVSWERKEFTTASFPNSAMELLSATVIFIQLPRFQTQRWSVYPQRSYSSLKTLSSKLEAMYLQSLCILVDGRSSRIASVSQCMFFQSWYDLLHRWFWTNNSHRFLHSFSWISAFPNLSSIVVEPNQPLSPISHLNRSRPAITSEGFWWVFLLIDTISDFKSHMFMLN